MDVSLEVNHTTSLVYLYPQSPYSVDNRLLRAHYSIQLISTPTTNQHHHNFPTNTTHSQINHIHLRVHRRHTALGSRPTERHIIHMTRHVETPRHLARLRLTVRNDTHPQIIKIHIFVHSATRQQPTEIPAILRNMRHRSTTSKIPPISTRVCSSYTPPPPRRCRKS